MAHPPTECRFTIDASQVLWLTRGRHWDYVFLLKPEPSRPEDWAAIRNAIFDGMHPTATPYSVAGSISGHTFVATTFLDASRRDDRARPVAHHLVWFPADDRPPPLLAPADWGAQFVAAFAPALDAAFGLDAEARHDGSFEPLPAVREAFVRALLPLPHTLHLAGPGVMLYRHVFASPRLKHPASFPEAPVRQPTRLELGLIWAAAVAVMLLVLFLATR